MVSGFFFNSFAVVYAVSQKELNTDEAIEWALFRGSVYKTDFACLEVLRYF